MSDWVKCGFDKMDSSIKLQNIQLQWQLHNAILMQFIRTETCLESSIYNLKKSNQYIALMLIFNCPFIQMD